MTEKKNKRRLILKDKLRIIDDFAQALSPWFVHDKSLFEKNKSMAWFLSLNGPILAHLTIQFYSHEDEGAMYWPEFNVENLSSPRIFKIPAPFYYLWIIHPFILPLGASCASPILYCDHENRYGDIVRCIIEEPDMPFCRSLTLDEIVGGYMNCKNFITGNNHITQCLQPILIATWCGEIKKAKELLEWGREILKKVYTQENMKRMWKIPPPTVTKTYTRNNIQEVSKQRPKVTGAYYDNYYDNMGIPCLSFPNTTVTDDQYQEFIQRWYNTVNEMIADPEILRQRVKNCIKGDGDDGYWHNNIEFVPYSDIQGVSYKERNLNNPRFRLRKHDRR